MWTAEYLFIWTNRMEYYWLSTLKFKFVYQLIEQKKKTRSNHPNAKSSNPFIFIYFSLLSFATIFSIFTFPKESNESPAAKYESPLNYPFYV